MRAADALSGRRPLLLLALGVLAYYGLATTRSTLWDRDEPRFAQATVEMIASGNHLYPTFNHELRPDKPILIYWLQSVPMRLFGAHEWTARFWAPVGIALTALFTALIGRRLLGPRVGFLAAVMLVSTMLVFVEGTAATVDAVLLACTTAAMAVFANALARGARAADWVLLTLALAFAQLTKGPVGLALPVLSILAALWMLRREPGARRVSVVAVGLAALASLGIFALWFLPANAATEGEFLRVALGRHVVERVATPMKDQGFFTSLPFYVPVVLVGFAPWTLWLPAAISAFAGGRLGGRGARALLLAWTVVTFVFMTLVATKQMHYVMTMWPALALLAAAALDAAVEGRLDERDRRWLARGAWLQGLVLAAQVVFFAIGPGLLDLQTLRFPMGAIAACYLVSGVAGLALHVRGRYLESTRVFLIGTCAVFTCVVLLGLPSIERQKVVPRMTALLRERFAPDVPIARFGYDPPSFDFYLNRPPVETLDTKEQVSAWTKRTGPGVLVVTRARIDSNRDLLPGDLVEIAAFRGLNTEKFRPIELVALGRSLP